MAARWTPEELEILDRVYPEGGSLAVHEALPHRSMGAIKVAAHWRGVPIIRRRPWDEEETATVIAHYPTLGAKRTAALVTGRSPQDVAVHANDRGVYRIWEAA